MSSQMNKLYDSRTDCFSVIYNIKISEYLSFIEEVYKNKGGIKGQRAPLKTKTAVRIRSRMVLDLHNGAVIPPIVIGAVVPDPFFKRIDEAIDNNQIIKVLKEISIEDVSIIDGMQRTTALLEAVEKGGNSEREIRLELWFAKNVNSLIYRMLVLNTGQVPWDIKRQLETVYSPILHEIKRVIPDIDIYLVDDVERRKGAGEYRGSKLIELFFAFTSRKTNLELKEKVAEDFARMDATETVGEYDNLEYFISVLKGFVDIDKAFSKATPNGDIPEHFRFKAGKDVFTSAPATIGFVAAAAVFIFGLPGMDIPKSKIKDNFEKLHDQFSNFCARIDSMDEESVYDFMDFATLNERLSSRSGKVGEYEREFFFRAFKSLFENGEAFESMQPAWMAW